MQITLSLLAISVCCDHFIYAQSTAKANIKPDISNPLGKNVSGSVFFTQTSESSNISITVQITGLVPESIHGWHVHGNLVMSQNCTTAGPHWNPKNSTHGAATNNVTKRHYGDLGNFQADDKGVIATTIYDHLISFFGEFPMKNNTLSLIIHEKPDDLGLGSNNDTLKTGNAGTRLACGNIVFQTENNTPNDPIYYNVSKQSHPSNDSNQQPSQSQNDSNQQPSDSKTQASLFSSETGLFGGLLNQQPSQSQNDSNQQPSDSKTQESLFSSETGLFGGLLNQQPSQSQNDSNQQQFDSKTQPSLFSSATGLFGVSSLLFLTFSEFLLLV